MVYHCQEIAIRISTTADYVVVLFCLILDYLIDFLMNFRITSEIRQTLDTKYCYIMIVANTFQYFIHNTWRVKCPPLPRFINEKSFDIDLLS